VNRRYAYLEPLVTAMVAGPMLGERTTVVTALGGVAILLGVWPVGSKPLSARREAP
jgi:drug/metabolite transporter (DMT)-like permease